MIRQVLYLHWKASRLLLVPFVLAAFGLPLLVVQGTGIGDGVAMGGEAWRAFTILQGSDAWLPLFPGLAAAVGATLALTAWNWDHQVGHVYALTLPIARWRYALLKLSAGALLVTVPAAALLAGALVATLAVSLPTGLHAYPGALALRFLTASLLAYALLFAMAAGTVRTTVRVLSALAVLVVAGPLLTGMMVDAGVLPVSFSFASVVGDALIDWPGPFHVFVGNWRLFDV